MRISAGLLSEMVAHALEDAPDECCGMVGARDGVAEVVERARNAEASPVRYVVEPRDQLRIHTAFEDAGLELGAIYHSHTRSEPLPSQTDVNLALTRGGTEEVWPGTLYIIVGVAGDEPDVRAWSIKPGGDVTEVPLEVV